MIYYTDYGKIVNSIEGEEYELKDSVRLDIYKGSMTRCGWDLGGGGCLYEGDEFFRTFCVMKYGFQPIMLEPEEYNVFDACGVVYFSKARKLFIREQLQAFRKKQLEPVR